MTPIVKLKLLEEAWESFCELPAAEAPLGMITLPFGERSGSMWFTLNSFARRVAGLAALVAMVAAVLIYAAHPVRGSNHQDTSAALNRPGADITDTYLFPDPKNANNVILVMNVHSLIPSGQGNTTWFDSNVLYQMQIDNQVMVSAGSPPTVSTTGAKLVIQFLFSNPTNSQTVTVYGPGTPVTTQAPQVSAVLATASGTCLLYTSPSPRDRQKSRMPSSA